jgi:hypothetical protein
MSQPTPPPYPPAYEPQYTFWPQYLTPPEELLAPARRAGILMIALGVLAILLAGCGGIGVASLPATAFEDALRQQRQLNPDLPEFSAQLLTNVMLVMMGVIGMFGLVAIILGVIVRLGSMVAAIFGLIFIAISGLGLLFITLTTLGEGFATFIVALAIMAVPLILCVATGLMLIQAIRAAPKVDLARRQLMQYHQQQQMAYYQQMQQQQMQQPMPPQQ